MTDEEIIAKYILLYPEHERLIKDSIAYLREKESAWEEKVNPCRFLDELISRTATGARIEGK